MRYVNLGKTGIKVSNLCLGMMSYGNTRKWNLEIEEAKPIVERALDAGINFYDTANVYANGRSEEITGELLQGYRDDVIVATKVRLPTGEGVNEKGLNRHHMSIQIMKSLDRLKMDYVDLYQIHRWDYDTDIELVMRSLNHIIDNGQTLHIGASSMFTWELAKAQLAAEKLALEGFSTMQNHYNALYREEEREMIPFCRSQNIGIIPWSPLARGLLTKPPSASTTRKESDPLQERLYQNDNDLEIINEIEAISKEVGVSMGQIALSWILNQPGITSPIIGVTKLDHLEDAISATELNLDPDYIKRISEKYTSRPVRGHSYTTPI